MAVPAPRDYDNALEVLNGTQTNVALLDQLTRLGKAMNEHSLPEMRDFLARIGYQPSDLDRLNVVHVTGTKGKGSTCAFVDSILRHTPLPLRYAETSPPAQNGRANGRANGNANGAAEPRRLRVGMYTSPHLVEVRERIKVDGHSIAKEDFARYFFEVVDRLEATKIAPDGSARVALPQYFRLLTLVAFHAFLSMKVDAVVLEVGIGGEYDSTNVVERPLACGVAALGLDHQNVLGGTLEEIAWNKAGIFKSGAAAYTLPQPEAPMKIIEERAVERQVASLHLPNPISSYPELKGVKLGLAGHFQESNASLAVCLAHAAVLRVSGAAPPPPNPSPTLGTAPPFPLPTGFREGLERARWPGRAQREVFAGFPGVTWFLDGAHTVESLRVCSEWYLTENRDREPGTRSVLVFNCTGQRRAGTVMVPLVDLHEAMPFSTVVFTANVPFDSPGHAKDLVRVGSSNDMSHQQSMSRDWSELCRSRGLEPGEIVATRTVEAAFAAVRRASGGGGAAALVAGSLHLVGSALAVVHFDVN